MLYGKTQPVAVAYGKAYEELKAQLAKMGVNWNGNEKEDEGEHNVPCSPGKSILAEVNNNEAGNIYNSLFAKNRKVEYDNKYIALVNIRTNPDNQIFRVMDDDEDIRILAEDIKRNGLMHNLVVFPEQHEEGMVYVLLSGERRVSCIELPARKRRCNMDIVNCNVW